MDQWEAMFGFVQGLMSEESSLEQSVGRTAAFARDKPAFFNEPDFWDQVQTHDFREAFDTLKSWVR